MRRALITGITGQDGSYLAELLLAKDYGYWITRSAHRIPNANPSQDPTALPRVANFFTSLDEESANMIAQELGSAYVIVDYEAASVSGQYITVNIGDNEVAFIYAPGATTKFGAVALWAGKEQTEFIDYYYLPTQGNEMVPVVVFHPKYYQSLSTRLYAFDGKAVTPQNPLVISYEESVTREATPYRVITGLKQFTSYEEAQAYISSQKSGNYKIVGTDPLLSPVPLEELKQYKLVFSSEETVASNHGAIPAVKVFEFTDRVSPYKP